MAYVSREIFSALARLLACQSAVGDRRMVNSMVPSGSSPPGAVGTGFGFDPLEAQPEQEVRFKSFAKELCLVERRTFRTSVANTVEHFRDRDAGRLWRNAGWRIPASQLKGSLARMWIGPIPHPSVLFAF
jgi:hypothetical protein